MSSIPFIKGAQTLKQIVQVFFVVVSSLFNQLPSISRKYLDIVCSNLEKSSAAPERLIEYRKKKQKINKQLAFDFECESLSLTKLSKPFFFILIFFFIYILEILIYRREKIIMVLHRFSGANNKSV